MAENYLRPEDVGTADARMVLDFLNAAQSAEEIASAVEVLGQLDIGVRLAQRLLDRRATLGEFTTLQQVADVPLIGPERFTEIVTSLSAARVPATSASLDVLTELRALRRDVDALRVSGAARPVLTLRTLQDRPFLGRAVDVVATATEPGSGRPLIGAAVVLAASWGRLRGVEGVELREGTTLRLRTGVDGAARAVLYPPTADDLARAQQAALESALDVLDVDAVVPAETRAGLEELSRRYRREGDQPLRRAVDIYFRDFAGRGSEPLNMDDPLAAWSFFEATLTAYLPDAETGSSVQAAAVLPLWMRDWLAPWLTVHEGLAEADAGLDQELVGLVRTRLGDEAAGAVLGRVYGRIQEFVDDQRGVVGEYVGRRVAGRSLATALDAGLAEATPETRAAFFPGAAAGTRLLGTAIPTAVFAGIGEARADVRRSLEPRLDASFSELRSSLTTVEGALASSADALGAFGARVAGLEGAVAGKADLARVVAIEAAEASRAETLASLSAEVGNLRVRVDSKADLAGLEALQARFDDRASQIDLLATRLDGVQLTLDARVAELDSLTSRFDGLQSAFDASRGELSAFDARLDGFASALEGKLDATRFDSFEVEVARRLDTKADDTRIAGFEADLGRQLATKADVARLASLEADVATSTERFGGIDSRLDDVESSLSDKADATRVGALEAGAADATQRLAGLDARLGGFETTLAGKVDGVRLDAFEADVGARLDAKADLGRVSALESSVAASADRITTFDARLGGLTSALDAKVDARQFDTFEADVGRQLAAKADATRLSALESTVRAGAERAAALDSRFEGFESRLEEKADAKRLDSFEADVAEQLQAKADVARLSAVEASVAASSARLAAFDARIDGVAAALDEKVDAKRFGAFEADVGRQLSAKADLARLSTVEANIAQANTRITSLQAASARLDRSVGTLSTDMTTIRRDFGSGPAPRR